MTAPTPTPLEVANAESRAAIAARFQAEYDDAQALAEAAFGPDWVLTGRHFLVDKEEEDRARKAGDRMRPAATVYSAAKGGVTRHFTVVDGGPVACPGVEAGFGDMYREPHPTQGFEHKGRWIPYQRFSLFWAGYELYEPKSADQLAAARMRREAKAVEREAENSPLFAEMIREQGYVKPARRKSR